MTLSEALRAAGGPYGIFADHKPIRRRGWSYGLKIWWSPNYLCWMSASDGRDPEPLFRTPTQGCLTPETMLADDWEVVTVEG